MSEQRTHHAFCPCEACGGDGDGNDQGQRDHDLGGVGMVIVFVSAVTMVWLLFRGLNYLADILIAARGM